MAREATITFEQVSAAANSIREQGVKPTARAIRDALGSGGMATVLKFFQQWQAGQVRQSQSIDDTLDPSIARVISNVIAAKVQEATATVTAQLADLQAEVDTLIVENERQASEISAITTDRAELQDKYHASCGTVAQLEADARRTAEDLAGERLAAESARVELAKASLRLEAVPRIEAEIERVKSELAAARASHTEAERQLAGSKAEARANVDRYSDAVKELNRASTAHIAEIERMQSFVAQANADAKQARDALVHATELLSNVQAQRVDEGQNAATRIGALESTIAALKQQIDKTTGTGAGAKPSKSAK